MRYTEIETNVKVSNIKEHQQILKQAQNIYDDIICGNILNNVENQHILINVINN